MAGISSKALAFGDPINKEKTFQGQRLDDELGLNWIQFKWRNHDPQIGRFIEIDPLSEKYVYNSTYAFSENNVTTHVELEGLEKESIHNPDLITFGSLNRPATVSRDVLQKGNYDISGPKGKLLQQKAGGKVKVNARFDVEAGAALEVKGVGVEGGTGVTFAGIRDNHPYFGKDLVDGKIEKTEHLGGSFLGFGLEKSNEFEKKTDENSKTSWEKTSETETARVAFIFTVSEQKDAKTNNVTTSYNLDWGAGIGIGLILRANITIPIFSEVRQAKR